MKNKAVVLGANYYIGLSIIRCLGRKGIDVVAVEYKTEGAYALKSRYLKEILIGPHYKDEPDALVAFLIQYAKTQSEKPVLFPSADPYVSFIDNHLEELKAYYLIPQTQQGLYTQTMNKETLADLAHATGALIPEAISPLDVNFEKILTEAIGFPCLVKPVDSPTFVAKYRKKLFQADNRHELDNFLAQVKADGIEVIVQHLIPGFDDHMYTYDAYLNQDSKVTHWLTCQKQRQYPINYGASVYTKQFYEPKLHAIGAPFLEGIGWKGFAEIEYKLDDKSGQFYLIEVNVRTTNLNVLLEKAGLNFPYIQYRDLVGHPVPPRAIKTTTGYVFWYAFEDFLAVRDYLKTKQLTVSEVFLSYFTRKAHSTWDIFDMKPYFSFFAYKIAQPLGRRVMRLIKRG